MNALDGEWKCQVIHKNTKTINVRENRRDNQEWAIQKNWQHWAYKTKRSKTKNTTQYVLVTIIRKQTQIT